MDLNVIINDFNKKYELITNEIINEKKYENIEIFINHINKYIKDFSNLDKETKSSLAQIYNLYNYVLDKKNSYDDILFYIDLAITLDPYNKTLLINKANIYNKSNKLELAKKEYEKVLEIEDDFFAFKGLANYYTNIRKYKLAKKYFNKSLTCIPIDNKNEIPNILNNIASMYYGLGSYYKYLVKSYASLIITICMEKQIAIEGINLLHISDVKILNKTLLELLENNNEYLLNYISINMLIPEYYNNYNDVLLMRENLIDNINKLMSINNIEKFINLKNSIFEKIKIGLPLSYQNINNVNINKTIGELYKKIFSDLYVISKNVLNRNNIIEQKDYIQRRKIKVGFISSNFFNHSVGKDRRGVINKIDRNLFEVYIFSYKKPFDIMSKYIAESGDHYIILKGNISNHQKLISELKLDIIIYADLGMDIRSYLCALGRLAPIQIATWGHSDTSGLDTIDYFISSKYFEINGNEADNNYSEKLIKMDSLSTYYFEFKDIINIDDTLNKKDKIKTKFGLPTNMKMFFVPHTLFKIYDDFDEIIKLILEKDNNVFITFIKGEKPYIYYNFRNRIEQKLGSNFSRIYFVDHQEYIYNFYKLLIISDVILDSYPFGGCNVSFEAFSLGKCIITLPSNYINGRFTSGLYRKMGLLDLICSTKEEYVDKALLLINDENLLNNMSKDILNNKYKIFETYDTIVEWNELLVKLSKDIKINITNNYYKNNIYDLSINDDMANLIYLNNLSKIYNPLIRNILNIGDYINKFSSLFIKIYDRYNLNELYDSLPAFMNDIINSTIIIGNGRKILDNEKNENFGYLIQLFKKVVRINNFEIYDYKNKIDYQKYIGNKTTDWVITDMTSYEQEKLDFSELENIHRFIPLLKRKNNINDTQYTNNPKLIDIDNKYELILKNEYYPNDENYWASTGLITLCKLLHENNNTNNKSKIFVIGFDFFENNDFIHYYDDQIISTDHKSHLERNIFNDLKKKFNNTLIDVFN